MRCSSIRATENCSSLVPLAGVDGAIQMELKLLSVTAQGDASKEYLTLRVLEDCNLKNYMIFDSTFSSNGATSNKHRHVFVFPSWDVKKGDYIFLRTRPGSHGKLTTSNSFPAHGFHWGLNSPVWNETGDTAHLIKISSENKLNIPAVAQQTNIVSLSGWAAQGCRPSL